MHSSGLWLTAYEWFMVSFSPQSWLSLLFCLVKQLSSLLHLKYVTFLMEDVLPQGKETVTRSILPDFSKGNIRREQNTTNGLDGFRHIKGCHSSDREKRKHDPNTRWAMIYSWSPILEKKIKGYGKCSTKRLKQLSAVTQLLRYHLDINWDVFNSISLLPPRHHADS